VFSDIVHVPVTFGAERNLFLMAHV
jgi:hypothetical protein